MKLIQYTLSLLAFSFVGFIANEPVMASNDVFSQDCSIHSDLQKHYNSEVNFQNYLRSIGEPTQVTVKGKTLKANRQYAVDRCIVVYGGPYDVPSGTQSFKWRNSQMEPRHFGFNKVGELYSNWNFPADGVGADYHKYISTRNHEANPWSNSRVLSRSVGKVPVPKNRPESNYVKSIHLNRAVDTFCGGLTSCFNAEGPRGHFESVHETYGFPMTGENLVRYASIQSYPNDYSPGSFNTYHFDGAGQMWYATHPMAPYKKLFNDTVDLSITDITITPTPQYTNNKIASVRILVQNNSPRNISNTQLRYGYDGKVYCQLVSLAANSTTPVQITQGQKDCSDASQKEDLFYPNIGTQKERTFDFVAVVNPTRSVPKDETNFSNNTFTKEMDIINPNASVRVVMNGETTAQVVVSNNTMAPISSAYNGETFKIEVFDTNNSADESAYTKMTAAELPGYVEEPSYNIAANGDSQVFEFELPAKKDREAITYLVRASIPHYAKESTYEDNKDVTRLGVQSHIDLPQVNACTEIAPYSNALKKLCAGHFPKHPSTIFSEGMQTYHFAMYRLTPQPMPNYSITAAATYGGGASNSKQVVQYDPASQDSSTFVMSNGGNTRSRMMPRHTDINYRVSYNQLNGAKVEVANGTIRHTLDNSCFSPTDLDLEHRTNCDQLALFLPNTDANKFNIPRDFNRTKRVSVMEEVIKDTKIPFVNPGTYTFELEVSEFFLNRKQDLLDDGTTWSAPYWDSQSAVNFVPVGATYGKEIYNLTYDYQVVGVKGSN